MADRSVNIRLSIRDGELVRRALQALGEDGEKALRRIEQAGEPASRALRAVDTASKEAQSAVHSWAEEAGAAGRVLSAFGPAGIAAAAGLGALTYGSYKLIEAAKQTADELDRLQDTAARLGVGTEFLQGLRFSAEQLGASSEKVDGALDVLNRHLGEIAQGGGKQAKDTLDRLGVSAVDANGRLKTIETLLPDLADGFERLGSTQEQAAAAMVLFGKGNQDFARALAAGAEGLERQMQAARGMGAVLDENLVRKGADAKDVLAALSQVISTQMQGALVEALPLVTALATAFAQAAAAAGHFVDSFREFNEQQLGTLQNRLAQINKELPALQTEAAGGALYQAIPNPIGAAGQLAAQQSLNKLLAERAQILEQIERLQRSAQSDRGTAGILPQLGVKPTGDGADATAKATTAAHALRDAYADVTKELQFQIEQTSRAAREQFIYNELQKAGVSIDSDRGQALAELAGQLYDAQQAEKEHTKAVEDAVKKAKEAAKAEAERLEQFSDAAKSSFKDLFSTLNSNLQQGQQFWDAFADAGISALDRLEAKLLDIATDRLFEWLIGGLLPSPGALPGLGLVATAAPSASAASPSSVITSAVHSAANSNAAPMVVNLNVKNERGDLVAADASATRSGPGLDLDVMVRGLVRDEISDRRGQKIQKQLYGSQTPVLRRR